MYVIIPEEMKKLKRIFKPYLDGVMLRKDAPQEAVEAHKKYYEWFDETLGNEQ